MVQVQVTYPDNLEHRDSLRVDRKLGEGKFSVFQVYSAYRRTSYALKVFPSNALGSALFKKEQLISRLSHPNIIKNIPLVPQETKGEDDCLFSLTEIAKFGDFFDVVNESMLNYNEMIIRTYFHQLVEGIEHMHGQGVAHLDLKLENLMLGTNFQLKVIDFDQSQMISDEFIESRGTENYRAPEVINGKSKDFMAADVYSMGVILFALMGGEFPFLERKAEGISSIDFSEFLNDNKAFWGSKSEAEGANFFTEEFIELVNGMLNFDAERRIKINEIKASKWYNGAILDPKNLKQEMSQKYNSAMRRREQNNPICN